MSEFINNQNPFIGTFKQIGEKFRKKFEEGKGAVPWNAVVKDNPNKDKDYVPLSNSGFISMKRNLELHCIYNSSYKSRGGGGSTTFLSDINGSVVPFSPPHPPQMSQKEITITQEDEDKEQNSPTKLPLTQPVIPAIHKSFDISSLISLPSGIGSSRGGQHFH